MQTNTIDLFSRRLRFPYDGSLISNYQLRFIPKDLAFLFLILDNGKDGLLWYYPLLEILYESLSV